MYRWASRLAAVCLPAVASLGLAAAAHAAPVAGPSGDAFYTPPSPLPAGANGDLIWYRSTSVNLPGAPAAKAWTVLYRSTDSNGVANAVTGTVIVPTTAVSGARPIVSYAFGTQGLAPRCAPSRQLSGGQATYEGDNIVAALQKGWAVVGTDYAGYTTGKRPTYLAGKSEGNAVLDIVKAATQIPSVGLSYSAKTAVWGYSQGGQAASFAGENKATYTPSMNLQGVAAGGVPGDFFASARNLNGSYGAAFLLGGVVGLANEFPNQVPFDLVSNAAGKAAREDSYTKCVFELLNKYRNKNISEFTEANASLDDLLAIQSVNQVISSQALGTKAIPAPVYQYHGQADEFLPLGQAYATKKAWCAKGTKVQFDLYPSEHIATQTQAAGPATTWIANRFAGQAAPTNCGNNAPPPVSTAPPGGGDFVVNLDKWQLGGTAYLDRLSSTLYIPSGSTFSGQANITKNTLYAPVGGVSIPTFNGQISLAGIKVGVKVTITQLSALQGTASLDDNGDLHLAGNLGIQVKIRSLNLFGLQLGTDCKTRYPVNVPYRYDGPVSGIGNGKLVSSTTTNFSEFTGCGVYGPLLSALASAPNNRFTLTLNPPAPKPY